eukprot:m.212435 g.212435  ORF g.212435 m.212435 type:complete len:1529 (+) comp10754_c0_seq1:91-4677(+)
MASSGVFTLARCVATEDAASTAAVRAAPTHCAAALALHGGRLLLYVATAAGASVVRHLRWFPQLPRRIVVLAWDNDAALLAAISLDGSVTVLPVLAMLAPDLLDSRATSIAEPVHIQPIRAVSGPITACCWWNAPSGNTLIVGTKSGSIVFIGLPDGVPCFSTKVKGTVHSLEIALDQFNAKTLLLIGADRHYRLVVQRESRNEEGQLVQDTIFAFRKTLPSVLSTLNPAAVLRVQTRRGTNFISVQDGELFEVYDVSLDRSPLYVFRLPRNATDTYLTDNLCFSASHDEEALVAISSNLFAGGSADTRDSKRSAVMQSFLLPEGESILALCARPSHNTDPSRNGCLVVSTKGIYQCRLQCTPEDYFVQILDHGGNPEPFGATLRLDLQALYLKCADRSFEAGDYDHAVRLYTLAQIPSAQVIKRFATVGQIPLVTHYMKQLLKNPAALQATKRKQLSELLFLCFVQQASVFALTPDTDSDSSSRARTLSDPMDILEGAQTPPVLALAFKKFILDNWDYNVNAAASLLLRTGMLTSFFEVCRARALVAQAISMPVHHGLPALTKTARDFLFDNGFAAVVSDHQQGSLLRTMPLDEALYFLLCRSDALARCMDFALPQLHRLSESALADLAEYLDPSRPIIRSMLTGARRRAMTRAGLVHPDGKGQDDFPRPEAIIRAFLRVVLQLNRVRKLQNADLKNTRLIPGRFDGEAAMRAIFEPPTPPAASVPSSTLLELPSKDRAVAHATSDDAGVACGSAHGVLLHGRDVWTWGKATGGRLGHGDIIEALKRESPLRVETLHMLEVQVKGVACGSEHTIARTDRGVYAWGMGSHGQLGTGETTMKPKPVLVEELSDKTVTAVACGHFHSLVLATDGVWAFGWGMHGQLGNGKTENALKPVLIRNLLNHKIAQIDCGFNHSVVLTANGEVLSFGCGIYGQLGHGTTARHLEPKPIAFLKNTPIRKITCGENQTLFLTHDDKMLLCGKSCFERGAESKKRSSRTTFMNSLLPLAMELPFPASKIVQMAFGRAHGLLLTDDGLVASWGANAYGQLGHGSKAELKTPRIIGLLRDIPIEHIAAGDSFSCAVDSSGQVWVWGRGDSGELGEDCAVTERCAPVLLPDIPHGRPLSAQSNVSDASMRLMVGSPPPPMSSKSPLASPVRPLPSSEFSYYLPDFSAGSWPFGEWTIPTCLTALKTGFDPTELLLHCFDLEDWDSAAHIYGLLGDYVSCLKMRLRAIEDHLVRLRAMRDLQHDSSDSTGTSAAQTGKENRLDDDGIDDRSSGEEDAEAMPYISDPAVLLTSHMAGVVTPFLRLDDLVPASSAPDFALGAQTAQIVQIVLSFWDKHQLSEELIDQVLVDNMSTAVCQGLHETYERAAENSVVRRLSVTLYISAIQEQAHMLASPFTPSNGVGVEGLWNSIMGNLANPHTARFAIKVMQLSKSSDHTLSRSLRSDQQAEDKQDWIAFSCGHKFTRREFVDHHLPRCQTSLKTSLGANSQVALLIVQSYSLRKTGLACPECVAAATSRLASASSN